MSLIQLRGKTGVYCHVEANDIRAVSTSVEEKCSLVYTGEDSTNYFTDTRPEDELVELINLHKTPDTEFITKMIERVLDTEERKGFAAWARKLNE